MSETFTFRARLTEPEAGAVRSDQVSFWPLTTGSVVVAPVVVPGT